MSKEIEILVGHYRRPGLVCDDYDMSNEVISTIQCGAARPDTVKTPFCKYRDDEGDNISMKNNWYSDYTGRYWMWKHIAPHRNYVGWLMYRKIFDWSNSILSIHRWPQKEIKKYAHTPEQIKFFTKNNFDLVINKPFYDQPGFNIENYFLIKHAPLIPLWYKHLGIIDTKTHPFFKFYKKRIREYPMKVRYVGLNIMRADLYNDMCETLFPIAFESEDEKFLNSIPKGYHSVAMGFLIERMFAVYYDWMIESNKIKWAEFPIIEFQK